MMFKKIIFILTPLLFINACDSMPSLDQVIPDRRGEYRKSEALPDLEVPPDLTTDALKDPLAIPNEEVTTLSEFERRKGRTTGGSTVDAAGIEALADEQWISVQGSVQDIWPGLKEFWEKKGYTLELEDPELGVLETSWLETGSEGIAVIRDKYSLFTETGSTEGTTVIFVNGEREEKIASADGDTWTSVGNSAEHAKEIISELNLFFYGNDAPAGVSSLSAPATTSSSSSTTASTSTRTAASAPRAEMLNLGDDKIYLSLPDEFTRAWVLTEDAILKTGMFIENNDRSKGIYYVLYQEQTGEEEGMFSKLKFWKDDEDEGKAYQISLTGVGDKTELVVLDDNGDWAGKDEASKILTYIQVQYNNAKR